MRLEMRTTDVLPVWLNEPDMPRLKYEALAIARISALRSLLGNGSAVYWDAQAAPKPAPAKRKATRKAPMMTGEEFFDARMAACRAIAAEYGENWHLVEGATRWASIPSKLRSFTTARGSKCKMRADARLPVARFWPGGILPDGVIVAGETTHVMTVWSDVSYALGADKPYPIHPMLAQLRNSHEEQNATDAHLRPIREARSEHARHIGRARGFRHYAATACVAMEDAATVRRKLAATLAARRQAERDAATPCVSLDTPAVSLAA